MDDDFDDMVTRVPGFAGIYYDTTDGAPVVLLTKRGNAGQASEPARAFANARPRRIGEPLKPLKFKEVRYDFRQLRRWRNQAFKGIASMPGIVSTDIDEVENTVMFGVATADAATAMREVIATLQIPDDAIRVMVVQRPSSLPKVQSTSLDPNNPPDPSQGSVQTLQTRWLYNNMGGVEINNGRDICTLGFNTQKDRYAPLYTSYVYDTQHYFVTNAHCMYTPGYMSGTWVSQGGWGGNTTAYWIGQERRQPRWLGSDYYGNPPCPPSPWRCSLADAALVAYVQGDGRMATIARPSGGPNSFSMDLDTFIPSFTITDSTQASNGGLAGTLVSKVGSTSGWTNGYTRGTCTDYASDVIPYGYLLCQDTFSATILGGDSGSPVFITSFDGRSARMVGLAWGKDFNRNEAIQSPYVYVRWELTMADYDAVCGTLQCWLGLDVSGYWH